jgi:peptidyl-prolyl cis-trans isomerase C
VRTRIALACLLTATAVGCGRGPSQTSPAASPAGPPAAATPKPIPSPLPDIVAEVNGQAVRGRFLRFVATERIQSGSVPAEKQDGLYREILDSLIVREVLFQEALARNVKADDKAVRAAYDQVSSRYPDEASWIKALAQMGLTPEDYRAEIRASVTVQTFMNAERLKAAADGVSEAEARTYYDSHAPEFDVPERLAASHILVAVAQGADAATRERLRAKAQALLAKARKGADFAKLARESSDDPGSAQQDGKLPAFARGQMVKPFEDAAFALKPKQISDLVETQFGYHIIQLHMRLPAQHVAFETIQKRLSSYLLDQKRGQAMSALVKQLRAKAKVDIKI